MNKIDIQNTSDGLLGNSENNQDTSSTWLFPTNNYNMVRMIIAGMLLSRSGFGDKYYKDCLCDFPGWFPLFRNRIPAAALASATSELPRYLLPCIAEIDKDALNGPCIIIDNNGQYIKGTLPDINEQDVSAILVRAPLPITLLKSVAFENAKALLGFEQYASRFTNVALSDIAKTVSPHVFEGPLIVGWPPNDPVPSPLIDVGLPIREQAVGGIITMLYRTASDNKYASLAYNLATQSYPLIGGTTTEYDPILSQLPQWMCTGKIDETAPSSARLFWGAVQALIDHPKEPGAERFQGWTNEAHSSRVLLEYLHNQLYSTPPSLQTDLRRLIYDMDPTYRRMRYTPDELIERHQNPEERAFLLFKALENCEELLDIQESYPEISDKDVAVASIIFGARDGWMGLPSYLQRPEELRQYVIQRMHQESLKLNILNSPATISYQQIEPPLPINCMENKFSSSDNNHELNIRSEELKL